MAFSSTDFGAYCIHPLDMLFVVLAGFCSDVVQYWSLGVLVTGLLVGSLGHSISVPIPAWLLATGLMFGRSDPQTVQWAGPTKPRDWVCLGSCRLNVS